MFVILSAPTSKNEALEFVSTGIPQTGGVAVFPLFRQVNRVLGVRKRAFLTLGAFEPLKRAEPAGGVRAQDRVAGPRCWRPPSRGVFSFGGASPLARPRLPDASQATAKKRFVGPDCRKRQAEALKCQR